MEIIDIKSPKELAAGVRYYTFDKDTDLKKFAGKTVYRLTYLHPKVYVEYYIAEEVKK